MSEIQNVSHFSDEMQKPEDMKHDLLPDQQTGHQDQTLALKPPTLPHEQKAALPLTEQLMSTSTPKEGNTIESQKQGFTQEEKQWLRGVFDMFDTSSSGKIDVKDLDEIMRNLQRDHNEARDLLYAVDPDNNGMLEFQGFLKLLQHVDNSSTIDTKTPSKKRKSVSQQHEENKSPKKAAGGGISGFPPYYNGPDTKVLDFLRLLQEYRIKCESNGNYREANKASRKFDELQQKETLRQHFNMRTSQDIEIQNIEEAQRQQFIQFSQQWDAYMAEYEANAYLSIEKLKERQEEEIAQFRERIEREVNERYKVSREVLDLRKREALLVKVRKYEDAEKIKEKADLQDSKERHKFLEKMEHTLKLKESRIRNQHQLALAALLKRIQRDRNEQLKNRQEDSQRQEPSDIRLLQRNKNLLNDLLVRQNQEIKKTLNHLNRSLALPKIDTKHQSSISSTQPLSMSVTNSKKKKSLSIDHASAPQKVSDPVSRSVKIESVPSRENKRKVSQFRAPGDTPPDSQANSSLLEKRATFLPKIKKP